MLHIRQATGVRHSTFCRGASGGPLAAPSVLRNIDRLSCVSATDLARESVSNRLIGSAVVIVADNGGFIVAERRRGRAQSYFGPASTGTWRDVMPGLPVHA